MTTTTVTPFIESTATAIKLSGGKSGGKWQKEILPAGTRKYKGQTLDFAKINPAVVQAFKDGAFDQVPFQFATETNDHNDDPDRFRGELSEVKLADDGRVLGVFDFSKFPETDEYVAKNPKFGVSSRIEVGYVRSDDEKQFNYALSHVLGTLKPHIRGMGMWEKVELSDKVGTDQEVLDLSSETDTLVDEELESDTNQEGTVPVQITKEEYEAFRRMLKEQQDVEATLAKMSNDDGDGGTASLSETDSAALVEAKQTASDALKLAEASQIELAQTRWDSKRRDLVLGGVPPFMLDLADPVMSQPKRAVIELSDKKSVDASDVITKILEGCMGFVDLSEEQGSQARTDEEKKEFDEIEKDLMDRINGL